MIKIDKEQRKEIGAETIASAGARCRPICHGACHLSRRGGCQLSLSVSTVRWSRRARSQRHLASPAASSHLWEIAITSSTRPLCVERDLFLTTTQRTKRKKTKTGNAQFNFFYFENKSNNIL